LDDAIEDASHEHPRPTLSAITTPGLTPVAVPWR
jgi:hypothetical protein